MLKKYLTIPLFLLCSTFQAWTWNKKPVEKSINNLLPKYEQLIELQSVIEHINRVEPLHDYILAVPPFVIVTNRDIHQFLASIPAPETEKNNVSRRKAKKYSMLSFLENLWGKVVVSINKNNRLTAEARQLLIQIREEIELAFKHDLTFNTHLAAFIKKAYQQNIPLIVRTLTEERLIGAKSAYPIKAIEISKAIGKVFASYYSESSIEQLLRAKSLPNTLYGAVLLQTFITNDTEDRPLISGVSCSYDIVTNTNNINSIEATYGHQSGLKNQDIAKDTFYLYQNRIYPVISKKTARIEPDFNMHTIQKVINSPDLQEKPTLDPSAIREIGRATKSIESHYGQPICLSFIKYSHTIYIIGIEKPKMVANDRANFVDELYIKKAIKDKAFSIVPLKPLQELIILKKRENLILAPDLTTFFELYREQENNNVQVGIIKNSSSPWSQEKKILNEMDIPVIWSTQFNEIQELINEKQWPLIIDPQNKLMFPYKKRKGFCTLFQTIIPGIKDHPLPHYVSVISAFIQPLHDSEKNQLKPDEFFSGVTIQHLFDLIRNESADASLQAIRTVLYRLTMAIKRYELSQLELRDMNKPFNAESLQKLRQQYDYIEQVAYQLYTMISKEKNNTEQADSGRLEKLFLINILEHLITQNRDENVVNNISFNDILST